MVFSNSKKLHFNKMPGIPPYYELSFSENLTSTATRTTCRGTKKVADGVEDSKNGMLKTTANSSNRRKAVKTSSCQSVSSQLDEVIVGLDENNMKSGMHFYILCNF